MSSEHDIATVAYRRAWLKALINDLTKHNKYTAEDRKDWLKAQVDNLADAVFESLPQDLVERVRKAIKDADAKEKTDE